MKFIATVIIKLEFEETPGEYQDSDARVLTTAEEIGADLQTLIEDDFGEACSMATSYSIQEVIIK